MNLFLGLNTFIGCVVIEFLTCLWLLQLFDRIKESQPEVIQKVFAVKGDITMEGLGLSDEDEARLAEEVQIVFHAAATINFTVSDLLLL